MIVCSCNVVSDAMIRSALDRADGRIRPRTPGAVYKCLGCSPNCGRCFVTVREIISEALEAPAQPHPRAPSCDGSCDAGPAAPFDGPPLLAAGA